MTRHLLGLLFILGPLFCESMFDGLCSSLVHSPLTVPSLWYHPHSIILARTLSPWQSLLFGITLILSYSLVHSPLTVPSLWYHPHSIILARTLPPDSPFSSLVSPSFYHTRSYTPPWQSLLFFGITLILSYSLAHSPLTVPSLLWYHPHSIILGRTLPLTVPSLLWYHPHSIILARTLPPDSPFSSLVSPSFYHTRSYTPPWQSLLFFGITLILSYSLVHSLLTVPSLLWYHPHSIILGRTLPPDSPFSLISPSFYHTRSYTPSWQSLLFDITLILSYSLVHSLLTVPSLWYHPHSIILGRTLPPDSPFSLISPSFYHTRSYTPSWQSLLFDITLILSYSVVHSLLTVPSLWYHPHSIILARTLPPDSPFSLISPSFYHTRSYTPSWQSLLFDITLILSYSLVHSLLTVPSLWYHPHSIILARTLPPDSPFSLISPSFYHTRSYTPSWQSLLFDITLILSYSVVHSLLTVPSLWYHPHSIILGRTLPPDSPFSLISPSFYHTRSYTPSWQSLLFDITLILSYSLVHSLLTVPSLWYHPHSIILARTLPPDSPFSLISPSFYHTRSYTPSWQSLLFDITLILSYSVVHSLLTVPSLWYHPHSIILARTLPPDSPFSLISPSFYHTRSYPPPWQSLLFGITLILSYSLVHSPLTVPSLWYHSHSIILARTLLPWQSLLFTPPWQSLLFGITLTPSNHLILGLPLFRSFPSSFFLRSAPLFSLHARTSSASYLGLPLRFIPLSVSRSCIFHSLSCRPLQLTISIVAISFIVSSAMSLPRSYHCHVQSSLGTSRSFSVTQHYTDSFPFF